MQISRRLTSFLPKHFVDPVFFIQKLFRELCIREQQITLLTNASCNTILRLSANTSLNAPLYSFSSRPRRSRASTPAAENASVYTTAGARRRLNAKGKQTKILSTPARAKQPPCEFSSVINSCCCS